MTDNTQQNLPEPKPATFPPPAGGPPTGRPQTTPSPMPQSFTSAPTPPQPFASAPTQPQYDRPKPPPPPPPEITIRTMESDLRSLKETGGAPPAPKPFTPPELKREFQPPTPPPQPAAPPPPPKITPADFGQPQRMEAPKPATPATMPIIEEEPKRSSRKLMVWGGAIVIVIGVGALGYFVLFPMLFPTQTPPPPPVITTPEQPITEIPGEVTPPTPQPLTHQSLLSSDELAAIQLPAADLAGLMTALQQEAQKTSPAGLLVELEMSNESGQLPSENIISLLLPAESENLKNLFEPDFTAALYYDADGAWPIYVFKLSLESSIVEAQTAVRALEASQTLANFFISAPGTPNAAGFKDGQVNGLPTRYLTYSKRAAALNLAWSGDKLIVSTSYNGLRKALTNLK